MPERSALIIDDDISIRRVLREALSDEGYEVREAADGQAALDELASWTPTVILLDLMMPVMDGWEFRNQQRSLNRAMGVPVVVLSASQRIAEPNHLAAAAVLAKPFDLGQMLDILDSMQHP